MAGTGGRTTRRSGRCVIALLALALYSGVVEELVFRGVVFRVLEEWLGTWVALVLASLLFGGLHLTNPDATLWGAVAIALDAGTLLTACYVLIRRLWLAIGLHFGWNFLQGRADPAPVVWPALPSRRTDPTHSSAYDGT